MSIVLDRKTITALQLDVTPASVARSLLLAPKLKLKQGHIRQAPSSTQASVTSLLAFTLKTDIT